MRSSKSGNCSPWTVIKITTIHSTDCNQITMGIWTRWITVIIMTDIFAVQYSKRDECRSCILFYVKSTTNKFWSDAEMFLKSFWSWKIWNHQRCQKIILTKMSCHKFQQKKTSFANLTAELCFDCGHWLKSWFECPTLNHYADYLHHNTLLHPRTFNIHWKDGGRSLCIHAQPHVQKKLKSNTWIPYW